MLLVYEAPRHLSGCRTCVGYSQNSDMLVTHTGHTDDVPFKLSNDIHIQPYYFDMNLYVHGILNSQTSLGVLPVKIQF